MSRLTHERLQALALDAIEEAAAASHIGPVPRTRALALALAWLLRLGKGDEQLPRWPFKSFWQASLASGSTIVVGRECSDERHPSSIGRAS